MAIDRKLNINIPIEREDGSRLYVIAAPVSLVTYREFYLVMLKANTEIYRQNLSFMGGPRAAAHLLRDAAKSTPRGDGDWWEGPGGVEQGLMGEIHRLANVLAPADVGPGWQTVPYEDAVRRKLFTEDELEEIENTLAFFTLSWRALSPAQRTIQLTSAGAMFGWQTMSSTLSEFRASLPTSTAGETSEARATA